MYTLVINEGPISIAHKLELPYPSPCNNLHGHNYYVKIKIASVNLDKNGMVVDFAAVKQGIKKYDHSGLGANFVELAYRNNPVGPVHPHVNPSTAEVFARCLWQEVTAIVLRRNPSVHLVMVTVWETRNNSVSYVGSTSEELEIRSVIGDKENE